MKPIVKEITQAQRKMAARGLKAAEPSTPGIEGKNIERWTAKSLLQILNTTYQQTKEGKKAAALVLGAAGIGKSEIVQNFARMVAKGEGREFVAIDDLKDEQREKVFADPTKWYVFLDLRAGQLNPEQAQGIPDVEYGKRKGFLRFLPPDWAYIISDERFSGMVFLDELNRGQESVINSLFQFVLDRIVSGRRVGSGCTIIAAANLGTGGEFSGTTTLDSALMSRFSVGVLVADADEWLDWAERNNIDKNIIAFVKSNPALNFYARGKEVADHNIPVNPRNITFADRNLKFVEQAYDQAFAGAAKAGISEPTAEELKQYLPLIPGSKEMGQPTSAMTGHIYNDIRIAIGSRLGTEWATSFIQFLETIDAFEWADILEKTKKKAWLQKGGMKTSAELDTSKLWALVNYILDNVVSRYNKASDTGNAAEKKKIGEELATILGGIPKDQVTYIIKALNNQIGKGRVDLPAGMSREQGIEQAGKNFVELMVIVGTLLKNNDPDVFKVLQSFLKQIPQTGVAGFRESMNAKRMYETITLSNRKPTPEQLKALEGSDWHHVYHGTKPDKNASPKFKTFFTKEVEDLSERKNLVQLAEYVIDKVEEMYGLHYSNLKTEKHSIEDVAKFAFELLKKVNAAQGDKEKIAKVIKKADAPEDMLVRLQVMSGAKY